MIPLDNLTLGIIAGAIIGLVTGIIVTVLTLERPHRWSHLIRVDQELHNRLKRAARAHFWSLRTEILHRLNRGGDR
jgi:hypothetical protein